MCALGRCRMVSAAAGGLSVTLFFACGALADTIVIDDFSAPGPGEAFFTFDLTGPSLVPKSPVLVETDGVDILGGQRDLLVEVDGPPSIISASGQVGADAGLLQVATFGQSGTTAFLQYDGVDGGDSEATGLDDNLGLAGFDLTDGGENNRLEMAFMGVDSGDSPSRTMGILITAVGAAGTSTATVAASDSLGLLVVVVPFSSFSDPSVLQSIDSLTFALNGDGAPTANVDFTLDHIKSMPIPIPEPSTLIMLSGLAVCLFCMARRRRNA